LASITLKSVVKTFPDGTTVVPGIDLEIKDREFIILVGPSGCGKSTTLRMIAGLEDITSGELYIGERLVNDVPPKSRDIAMVFQSYALYPHMTVYKNMAFALELRNVPKEEIDKKVRSAAKILDIEKYLSRKPRVLSGGQRQRVALGRAMVRDPAVFLLDEPLSNLDAKLRAEMRTQIAKLHRDLKTTFVYVTHDQTEAMTMADRIVVMRDGKILQIDTPENLYRHPNSLFVAGFIGTPQMNFLPAKLLRRGEKYFAEIENYSLPLPERMTKCESLKEFIGKDITLGIRPEHISRESSMRLPDGSNEISIVVDISEMMGAEIYLYTTISGEKLTAKIPSGENFKSGEKISLFINTDKIHIFDTLSEKLICD